MHVEKDTEWAFTLSELFMVHWRNEIGMVF